MIHIYSKMVQSLANHFGVSIETPVKDLPEEFVHELLYGTNNVMVHLYMNQNMVVEENIKLILKVLYQI